MENTEFFLFFFYVWRIFWWAESPTVVPIICVNFPSSRMSDVRTEGREAAVCHAAAKAARQPKARLSFQRFVLILFRAEGSTVVPKAGNRPYAV